MTCATKREGAGTTAGSTTWSFSPTASGWAKTWSPDSFFPLTGGGYNDTYMCDYFYNDAAAGARVVLRGGYVYDGAGAGVGCVYVVSGLATAYATIGGRLAC